MKQILDQVQRESGLDTETEYATNSDDAVLRLVSLVNRSARVLAKFPWQAMRKTHLFTLTSATTYDLPTDFRELIPDTAFTESYYQSVDFRVDPSLWRYLQSNSGGSGPRYKFRILGGKIHVFEPNSGDQVTFEYLTDGPVVDKDDGSWKARFENDDDTWLLDDDLLIMETLWRNKKLLGLPDWQVDAADARAYLKTTLGQEAAAKTIVGMRDGRVDEPYTDLWV